jgi:hypothetical protein
MTGVPIVGRDIMKGQGEAAWRREAVLAVKKPIIPGVFPNSNI